jgi:hypothetical protein
MSEPIHLPSVTPYGGWSGSSEQTPTRQRRKSSPTPSSTSSEQPAAESDTSNSADQNHPGQMVDYQA